MSIAEWASAIGEFVIAFVIFLELEVGRRDGFLKEAAQMKNYEDRGKLYTAFYNTDGESTEDKSKRFCDRIWKREGEDVSLKASCERQIVLFNRLGQIHRHAFLYRGDYTKLFPHAVVLFWIMVEPYIEKRRIMTGEWWARDFEQLTNNCLSFLLKNLKRGLTLYDGDPGGKKDFVIPIGELIRLQEILRSGRQRVSSS
jgi:hypothetical protein